MSIPERYIPQVLSKSDSVKQKANIKKSRKLYRKGVYYQRPKVKSFKSKKSRHLEHARELYKIQNIVPSRELAKKTKCSQKALEKIVNKGRGAYYSSGSRPNQTAESWGIARLASSITGGNASVVDYHLLKSGCKSDSIALKRATQKKRATRKKRDAI